MDDKFWFSLISVFLSISTFLIGRFTFHKQEGERNGYLASDIGYIKAGIDDLKTEIRTLKVELAEISTRVARLEEQMHSAFTRIEKIESE